MENSCKTKYPILLVHGCGFRDYRYINYWGRIPKVLEHEGAQVFYGYQDSWATIETNADMLTKRVREILEETGAEKLNLIAHSKGGLDSRYMITTLGMADKIATLTTVSTPHHGSKTLDKLYKAPAFLFGIAGVIVNAVNRILGDKKPDFVRTCRQFTTAEAERFNENNPDAEGVFYQSYATVMNRSMSDFFLWICHAVIKRVEGDNDGLVAAWSARWTNFKGVLRSSSNRGISHADSVDWRRHRFSKREENGRVSDMPRFYLRVVRDLAKSGY